jgi:hypothetical protein
MANIIPFDGGSGKLPAYLKSFNVSELNSDLTAHAGGGFPVISIKGKNFAIVRDGERVVIPNPKDPDSPATSIEVVLIKANKGTSKVFYLKGYDPKDSEGAKPDCYSPDGVAPAADAQKPQSKKCATCAHNQWGSRITEKGASKGKACNDTVRMAVAPAGQLNDPMLLRVPPASIRALGEYGQLLAKRGVGYNMVVTKVAFDTEAESPKLTFKPVGFLDDEGFAEVREVMESDTVRDILGSNTVAPTAAELADADGAVPAPKVEAAPEPKPAAKTKTVTDEEVETAVKAAEKPAAKPKKEAKPAPVVEEDEDLELDGIDFDD